MSIAPTLVQAAASRRLDEIYRYTREKWGDEQAARYIGSFFEAFGRIGTDALISKPIPAEFKLKGFYFRHERHVVYWRYLSNGEIGVVTILHHRMHQFERFRDDAED